MWNVQVIMSESGRFDFKKIKKHAQELRANQTDSEKLLWKELRGRKLSGYKFLRQYPILYQGNLIRFKYFIADFYYSEKKVIIELDGPVHDLRKNEDIEKDTKLNERGFYVKRIKNKELDDISKVLRDLKVLVYELNQKQGR